MLIQKKIISFIHMEKFKLAIEGFRDWNMKKIIKINICIISSQNLCISLFHYKPNENPM